MKGACWMLRSGDYVWDDSNQEWTTEIVRGRRFFQCRDALRFRDELKLIGAAGEPKARAMKVTIAESTQRRRKQA